MDGKVAVVTGTSRGLGLAIITEALAREGASVVLSAHSKNTPHEKIECQEQDYQGNFIHFVVIVVHHLTVACALLHAPLPN